MEKDVIYLKDLKNMECPEELRFPRNLLKAYQPERSKREDLIKQLQQELIERSKLNVEIVKAQLGCGALNSMET